MDSPREVINKVDQYKINEANELYAKIRGALWALEKVQSYEEDGEFEDCHRSEAISEQVDKWSKEIDNLGLTKEERAKTGFDFIDDDLAKDFHWAMRV